MSRYNDLKAILLYTKEIIKKIKDCFESEFCEGFASFLEISSDKVRIEMDGKPERVGEDQFEWGFHILLRIDQEWYSLEGLFKIVGHLDEIKPGKISIMPTSDPLFESFSMPYDYEAIFERFIQEISKFY